MPLSTATITFDLADMLGVDFDARRTKVWVSTNVENNTVIDTDGNKIRLGSGNVTLAPDGTGSFTTWVPGPSANPLTWQTSVHIDYPDRNAGSERRRRTFGPYTITASGDLADLEEEQGIPPEYLTGNKLDALLAQVAGYTDHGDISGTLTLTALGTHVLDASGPLTITLPTSADDGEMVTLLVVSGADDVSVSDAGDAEFTDGGFATFVMVRGSWVLASSGAASGPPDTTPPSAVTDLSATGGEGEIVADWSAATDAESTVRYRYRAWLTSGGASGEWVTKNDPGVTITGLDSGAYTLEVYAYSAGGASATDTATATVTAPLEIVTSDTFTGANGILSGHVAETGQTWGGGVGQSLIANNKLDPNNASVWINNGAVAKDVTADVTFASGETHEVYPWVSSGGTSDAPRSYISQSGQLSLNAISVTYNASGGTTNNYTPDGYLPLTAGSTHVIRTTYDGSLAALYVDGVKIIEGTPTGTMTGTYTKIAYDAHVDNLVVKA